MQHHSKRPYLLPIKCDRSSYDPTDMSIQYVCVLAAQRKGVLHLVLL